MWHFISEHISEATDALFVCQHRTKATGGDSHEAFIIHDERRRFFVKIRQCNDELVFHHEAHGLQALSQTQAVNVPAVICQGTLSENQSSFEYIVLSHLKFCDGSEQDWLTLGNQLARLHSLSQGDQYGWSEDNWIGQSRQINGWHTNWASFFAECRIGVMLEALSSRGVRLTNTDVFVTRTAQLLEHVQPLPVLVHGDLWSGNVGFCKRGPVIFDPAVYLGDRETDIAMTELFGGFPPAFYEGYQSALPLDGGYSERKCLYQLYHILNHALIFGGHYQNMAKSAIDAFNAKNR